MRANTTRQLLDAGNPALGLFVSSASPLAAEVVGHLGFDWVLIDLQHGENNLGNLSQMLQAVSTTAATPFVRVPLNDPHLIGRALDLGAYGIVVPLVNSVTDAEAAVRAACYAPLGARSWGPIRGSLYGGDDYFGGADETLQLFVMIETAEAVANARDILAIPGVSGCLVGLNDLSITLGLAPEGVAGAQLPQPLEEALATVVAACAATGKVPGVQLYGVEAINARIGQGFRLIGCGTELRLLRGAATELLRGVTAAP
jgi:4-hydroxy-2-oxoheptanedioate aldolase